MSGGSKDPEGFDENNYKIELDPYDEDEECRSEPEQMQGVTIITKKSAPRQRIHPKPSAPRESPPPPNVKRKKEAKAEVSLLVICMFILLGLSIFATWSSLEDNSKAFFNNALFPMRRVVNKRSSVPYDVSKRRHLSSVFSSLDAHAISYKMPCACMHILDTDEIRPMRLCVLNPTKDGRVKDNYHLINPQIIGLPTGTLSRVCTKEDLLQHRKDNHAYCVTEESLLCDGVHMPRKRANEIIVTYHKDPLLKDNARWITLSGKQARCMQLMEDEMSLSLDCGRMKVSTH